jgi:hypothetical protein
LRLQTMICAFLALSVSPFYLSAAGLGKPVLSKTGPVHTLMPDKFLGMRYFPDVCLTQIKGNAKWPFRALVAAGVSTRLIQGRDLEHISQSTEVLKPGPKGSFSNGYAGISGAYYHSDGNLYALFHAEDQENMPPIPGGVPGFFCCVGLALSKDGGETFTSLGPVITSQKPKSWTAFDGQPDRGAGEQYCVTSQDGRFLYAYYDDHSRVNNRGVQIFLARCDLSLGPPVPGNWRKYYRGAFSEPGIGGLDTAVMSADSLDQANAVFPFVDFSPFLKKYVMLFNIDAWKEHGHPHPDKSGIYAAYSRDGIAWSPPERVIKDFSIFLAGKSVSWHPAMIWDSFEKRGGLLVFAYSPEAGHDSTGGIPHYMAGQRIRFDLQ